MSPVFCTKVMVTGGGEDGHARLQVLEQSLCDDTHEHPEEELLLAQKNPEVGYVGYIVGGPVTVVQT